MTGHVITRLRVEAELPEGRELTLALVTDLHNGPWEDVENELRRSDAILLVGDLVNRHRKGYELSRRFLEEAPKLAPVFYSIGNHERKFRDMDVFWPLIHGSDAVLLDNRYVSFHGFWLGGLSSRVPRGDVDAGVVERMAREKGFHLLMCHHPEYYPRYVKGHGIELTVSGHAHGGQVCICGRGLYAPGQGLFPKLTSGFYDQGHLLVSRGMTNSSWAPRLWDPLELILLTLVPRKTQ